MEISDKKYQDCAAEVEEMIKFNQEKRANRGVKIIGDIAVQGGYAKSDPALFAAYNKLIAKLKWVALSFCNEDEIVDLFKNNLAEMLQMEDYDLWSKFATVLIGKIIAYEKRDEYKEKIKAVLNKNQELITSDRLVSGLPPTTENWIKDYTSMVGLGSVESVKMQNYFLNGPNFKKLKTGEKERMKKFFQFYERLKLSSLTVAGLEETMAVPIDEDGTIGYIRDGKIEKEVPLPPDLEKILDAVMGSKKVTPEKAPAVSAMKISPAQAAAASAAEKRAADLQAMAAKYPSGSLQRKAVEEEIKKVGSKK